MKILEGKLHVSETFCLLSLMRLQFWWLEIIKHKGKYVDVAALKWLTRYEANPVEALTELLLTMFEVCAQPYKHLNMETVCVVHYDLSWYDLT